MTFEPKTGDVIAVRAVLAERADWNDPPGCWWWHAHVPDEHGSYVDVGMVSPSEGIDESGQVVSWALIDAARDVARQWREVRKWRDRGDMEDTYTLFDAEQALTAALDVLEAL